MPPARPRAKGRRRQEVPRNSRGSRSRRSRRDRGKAVESGHRRTERTESSADASGTGVERGPRAQGSHPGAGKKGAAPGLSAGSGAAHRRVKMLCAAALASSLDEKFHMGAAVAACGPFPTAAALRRCSGLGPVGAARWRVAMLTVSRTGHEAVGFRPVPGEARVIGHRLLILRARRIVLSEGASGESEGCETEQDDRRAGTRHFSRAASRRSSSTLRRRSSLSPRRFRRQSRYVHAAARSR
jgi:hypothetical protein